MSNNQPMNPRIKQLWLDALRSGEYEQGKEELKTPDGRYCCLGVLCEIAVKEDVIPAPKYDAGGWVYGTGEDFESTALPRIVEQWAGMTSSSPSIELDDDDPRVSTRYLWLANENDSGNSDFLDIAEIIERYL